jgi:hypothetical protein
MSAFICFLFMIAWITIVLLDDFNEFYAIVCDCDVCRCAIYDSFLSMTNTIFMSNVTSDKYGEPYDPLLYALSTSNRKLLQCYRCHAYEPCTALVGLFATTGANVQRHEVFDWDFSSSDPPDLEEPPFYQEVSDIQELTY